MPADAQWVEGLSPRVRGNHHPDDSNNYSVRSIPASAGEPPDAAERYANYQVYPRECGGTAYSDWFSVALGGLSPRVRGNLG